MSKYFLSYVAESETVTNSDVVTELQAGHIQLRLFEANGANMKICYRNL
jgi:hypothetical protein